LSIRDCLRREVLPCTPGRLVGGSTLLSTLQLHGGTFFCLPVGQSQGIRQTTEGQKDRSDPCLCLETWHEPLTPTCTKYRFCNPFVRLILVQVELPFEEGQSKGNQGFPGGEATVAIGGREIKPSVTLSIGCQRDQFFTLD
jgi:hypothetical protein